MEIAKTGCFPFPEGKSWIVNGQKRLRKERASWKMQDAFAIFGHEKNQKQGKLFCLYHRRVITQYIDFATTPEATYLQCRKRSFSSFRTKLKSDIAYQKTLINIIDKRQTNTTSLCT